MYGPRVTLRAPGNCAFAAAAVAAQRSASQRAEQTFHPDRGSPGRRVRVVLSAGLGDAPAAARVLRQPAAHTTTATLQWDKPAIRGVPALGAATPFVAAPQRVTGHTVRLCHFLCHTSAPPKPVIMHAANKQAANQQPSSAGGANRLCQKKRYRYRYQVALQGTP